MGQAHNNQWGHFTDVMVDIETTGVQPDKNAIIQIAAVKFNLSKGTISPDFFNMSLEIPRGRYWDEGTRRWWSDKPTVYADIVSRAQDPKAVMEAFLEWARPHQSLRFWSKPTHFDYMFVSSYFSDYDMPNPFSYRDATDLNSYLRGLYAPFAVDKLDIPFDGDAHNALDDTIYQIKMLLVHCNHVMAGLQAPLKNSGVLEGEFTHVEIPNS